MTAAKSERTGGGLCGGVKYATESALNDVLQCHCENCRRLSGNFVAAVRSETSDLRIEDNNDNFRWHDLGFAKYGFCQGCGSTLFFRPTEGPDITSIMVGTLDNADGLELKSVWFAAEAQPHNELPDAVPRFAGNDV